MNLKDLVSATPRRVADMVRELFPTVRQPFTVEEIAVAEHLRGNERLYQALTGLVRSRIAGRELLPVPSDPLMCKSLMERDRECRWFLARLEAIYRSPNLGADAGEPPA